MTAPNNAPVSNGSALSALRDSIASEIKRAYAEGMKAGSDAAFAAIAAAPAAPQAVLSLDDLLALREAKPPQLVRVAQAVPVASELPPRPESSIWMTYESWSRLRDGGNCKGAVPVHGKPSSTAKIPLFTAEQMRAYALTAITPPAPGEPA